MHPVVIVLYEGVSAFEAMGALAALRAAQLPAQTVAADALVPSREGARLVPHALGYASVESAAAAILPGGDARKALADAALAKALRARRGHHNLAAGEGARILAAAGLVDGRRIARLPGDAALPGAEPVHSRLVADARLLTCFAGDALIDLVLHYVAHEHGHERAASAAAALGREFRPFAYGQT